MPIGRSTPCIPRRDLSLEGKEAENRPYRLNAEDEINSWNLLKPIGIIMLCKVQYDLNELMEKEPKVVEEEMS